ncbi:cysteine desulfurase [Flavobacterium sp. GSP27]|uniref:cysteine desulfurase family protein n=1 Tax=Flavobacterium sp. GSP27 TaxID=2497489 RepID=UPI000F81E619|nr:cysteine desulfurase family protein [Flavobacterium sp. GSP27]RTZ10835.1 cysteine desulfurase [Flavobacterium sp. GSP27]
MSLIQEKIYLDNNATTRIDDRVLDAMLPYFTNFYANANSSHLAGLTVKEAVEQARWQTAELIQAKPNDIIFTSGATEAINLAIKGLANEKRKHIVTVITEHEAVLDTCLHLETIGYKISYLGVNKDGILDLDLLTASVTEETALVIVMMANNETGTLQDIKKIGEIAKSKEAYFLCDATQAIGKIPINVVDLGIDLLSLSAHKFYGPKGIGALFVSKKIKAKLTGQITGGGQQNSKRSGTLNVPGIIGLGKACEIASLEMEKDRDRITIMRDLLERELLKIPASFVNGSQTNRLYNTTNICFRGVNSENLILALQNISVSNGSACSAVTSEPSHVLKALGLTNENALSSIRFSLGKFTTLAEIELTIATVSELTRLLKS